MRKLFLLSKIRRKIKMSGPKGSLLIDLDDGKAGIKKIIPTGAQNGSHKSPLIQGTFLFSGRKTRKLF
jgi:hypothetical protein